jgi:hypothetical protein
MNEKRKPIHTMKPVANKNLYVTPRRYAVKSRICNEVRDEYPVAVSSLWLFRQVKIFTN